MAIQASYIEANDWLNLIFRVGLSVVIGGLIDLGYWQLAVVGTVAMLLVLSGVTQTKRPIGAIGEKTLC